MSQEEIEKARKDLEKLRKANEDACDDSEVTTTFCTHAVEMEAHADLSFALSGLPERGRTASCGDQES